MSKPTPTATERMKAKADLWNSWRYEFEAWMPRLMSAPIALIVSKDHSEPYEMDRKHIFRLENSQYAFITESGCSCYEASEAQIELAPNLREAKKLWNANIEKEYGEAWKQERLA